MRLFEFGQTQIKNQRGFSYSDESNDSKSQAVPYFSWGLEKKSECEKYFNNITKPEKSQ